MKIIVRVMAEAQAPVLERELLTIEDTYTQEIVNSILQLLSFYTPTDFRMSSAHRKTGLSEYQKE